MSETSTELNQEERLKAIAYNFVKLYDRIMEERLATAKQAADIEALINKFTEQVQHFKLLAPEMRQHIHTEIRDTTKQVTEITTREATRAAENLVNTLEKSVKTAGDVIEQYKTEIVMTNWKVIGTAILTTIATCLLIVWLLMPTPTLPLTTKQLNDLQGGQLLDAIWPKLSKAEQQHWLRLAKGANLPDK